MALVLGFMAVRPARMARVGAFTQMSGVSRGLRQLFMVLHLSVVACLTAHECIAGNEAVADSMRAASASLSIYVAGGEIALVDPRGHVNRGGPAPLAQIPNCSRIEGSTKGVHSREEAEAARVQLDLLSPSPGSYRLAVQAKSRVLLVQVSGASGGVRRGGGDHFLCAPVKTYVWVVRWSVNRTDGRCALSIKRATTLRPDPFTRRPI
jgi:hypothetical protein